MLFTSITCIIIYQVHNRNCYECDVCSAQFKSKEGLALHKRKKHTTSKSSVVITLCKY